MSHQEIMDGNTAAAYVAYAFSEIASIYPITPSSRMGECVDCWQAENRQNIFGTPLTIVEMQSEAGVAGFVHGSLKTGALTTTFTSSQGLLLMLPNMYKIAGELLPTVFHVATRSVSTNALSIFGDHSDVMAVRQSGFAILVESTVQEVMDLAIVAHVASLETSVPFISCFDGFLTSHEMQKIQVVEYEEMKGLINQEALEVFRSRAMNPNHPTASGTNQGPDLHFQQREAVNRHYDILPYVVKKYMKEINRLRGTDYDLVTYYGHAAATELVVAMGSVVSTIRQTVDYLNLNGRKVGLIQIHLYRPFPIENFLEKIPKTVEAIAVLDRTKEPGAVGEPLFMDVQSALYESKHRPKIIGGRYGIGSKDTSPDQIVAIYDELQQPRAKKHFTVGIDDEVTNLSLPTLPILDLTSTATFQAKFWGLSGDGSISVTKSMISIIGNQTPKQIQAYFYYDSRKQNGVTVSHLRVSDERIQSSYFVQHTDFIGVTSQIYLRQIDVLKGLKRGGIFLLNTTWSKEELSKRLPAHIKKFLADYDIQFYIINAYKIAHEVGLIQKFSICMQVAFFQLTHFLPLEEALKWIQEEAMKTCAKKSEKILEQNLRAIALSISALERVEVPKEWQACEVVEKKRLIPSSSYAGTIQRPLNRLEGQSVSVGQLVKHGMVAGDIPLGTAPQEKRSLALEVPQWDASYCVQCSRCSFVCPHAAIRPFLVEEDELNRAPEGYRVRDFKGKDGLMYRIQVSVENCTGCELCVNACPAKGRALKMMAASIENEEILKQEAINWAFSMTLRAKENPAKPGTIAYTQFEQPLLEFSGACSGCGETPYVKLLTQLFGDRMMIANATGCSSIWGAMAPTTPYSTNKCGQGPAWSNSLLEDNAEFGYGMMVASMLRRKFLIPLAQEAMSVASPELSALLQDWIVHINEGRGTRARSAKLINLLEVELSDKNPLLQALYEQKDLFVKPSQWIVGGDGWAYDIGYGGLDHILASGADVNILVLDNEIYSNTGGHVSKATPTSAIARFSSSGNRSTKKDLGRMAMTYGNVYVAQVASGANPIQVIKAFEEAENYPGPSLVIAYVPCIAHGLEYGMKRTLEEAKEAVESGYWSLYRYNPQLEKQGKNPMVLDFKRPKFDQMLDFMLKQERFSSLIYVNPLEADKLFQQTIRHARHRFKNYAILSEDYENFLKNEQKIRDEQRISSRDSRLDSLHHILETLNF
ncbi:MULTISPECIES: pyruvate:ferredoxin (flavodoxin) oxidoreductase [unclassified Streptococcus]|uniref:pyruvate:ferredoxin (flavodoxin) oxidoreductase n=1 Tax=unclassified Streptococcus TaxID=2608887 RepID=UPI0010720F98|nr:MULTISPECIES: pyruvate:ferredoxin (flavodoxin) oxidoreductase [unclassified Streptococcus]MBF0786428.1 pyruvate:ferredoxin (flavodoxin) oxidoreductase [Streptococcus sp. 19428wC2_LYSM12]MCQ9212535.1 pyruvate:ferredoxin (flavodoxin) oxidoreductase [Streptococcus sp. B01]MCQ9213874.1 pyruvate:ferredoxin (flavodoxin) oxidoreductase [Streptococcus sp. O1]TFV06836.1 pyruvate:ferredoxin (flavodoxin) oxidoreductase [Streptococcus sp. LYSM12]